MKIILSLILSVCFTIVLTGQEYYGGENGKKLDWVLYYLNEYYVDSTDSDALTENAIRSMFTTLDPYSVYQSKEEINKQMQNDNGIKEVGIGATLYNLNGEVLITYITPESPADNTNIEKGDIIQAINNKSVDGQTINEIYSILNGEANTEVTLLIKKPNLEIHTIPLTRNDVAYKSVTAKHMITKNTGYIKLSSFTLKTIEEFKAAFGVLHNVKNLVLDLRGNRGGVVDAAYELADLFLDGNKVIYSKEGKSIENESYKSTNNTILRKGKVVVLTDGNTASASEIFMGALQEWDRCLIIGEPSFGKGLIQQSYSLEDSSAVRLTIGRYRTPTGRNLQRAYDSAGPWINRNVKNIPISGILAESNIPVELTSKSKGGRMIVKDDGGIHPDIYKLNDTPRSSLLKKLYETGLLYDYAVTYFYNSRKNNISKLNSTDAELTKDLHEYLLKKVSQGYTQLLPLNDRFENFTIVQLKSWITSLFGSNDDYYQKFNSEDRLVQHAIGTIQNKTFDTLKIQY